MNRTDREAIQVRRVGDLLIAEANCGKYIGRWDPSIVEEWNYAACAETFAKFWKITGTWYSAKLRDGSYVFTRTNGHGVFEI